MGRRHSLSRGGNRVLITSAVHISSIIGVGRVRVRSGGIGSIMSAAHRYVISLEANIRETDVGNALLKFPL